MSVDTLRKRLKNNVETIVVDTRFDLKNASLGREKYEEGHIPTAFYIDLNKDLSGSVGKHGGSHPLPNSDDFIEKLSSIGIDENTVVVAYGQGNDMFPMRFWWMIHHLGHEHVFVLDGGIDAWKASGQVSTTKETIPTPKQFIPNLKEDTIDIELVKQLNENQVLLDARSKERYLGKEEAMYEKAGHIPKAKSYFWADVLNKDGSWKSKEALEKHFSELLKEDEIIVSCGSGVSACANIIGLKEAGFNNVTLYPGSFSDWISYEDNRIETKEQ